jgi:putative two-component system response regulator
LWPIGVLVVGLVFTGLLAGHLMMGIQHTSNLEEKVREQTADIRSTQEDVLYRLASASQTRDGDAPAHLRRIAMMSPALAGAVDWLGDDVDSLRQAAPMHDIGKVGIPDAILNKTGALTPEESELLKAHTRIGAEILGGSKTPMLVMAREIALNHHEQWDGKGYPRGLAGKNIPESARIVAIVDAYDTLTHDGLNHTAVSSEQAVAMMQKDSEKRFDPTLLAAFVRILPDIRRIAEKYPDKRHNGTVATPSAAPIQTSTEATTWSSAVSADV